jgi:CBS domain-containing protein
MNFTEVRAIDRLVLDAETAADLMTWNPVSVHQDAALGEVIALLTDREISAAPVIDDAGRPVGVVSRTDIVRHLRAKGLPAFEAGAEPPPEGTLEAGFSSATDLTPVREIMTPAVLSVAPTAPVIEVVGMLVGVGRVYRLFVIDEGGVLVGVISVLDVLRKLRRGTTPDS